LPPTRVGKTSCALGNWIMAKKKRKKQKNKYAGISVSKDAESRKQMRDKFPKELVDAFIKICEAD